MLGYGLYHPKLNIITVLYFILALITFWYAVSCLQGNLAAANTFHILFNLWKVIHQI